MLAAQAPEALAQSGQELVQSTENQIAQAAQDAHGGPNIYGWGLPQFGPGGTKMDPELKRLIEQNELQRQRDLGSRNVSRPAGPLPPPPIKKEEGGSGGGGPQGPQPPPEAIEVEDRDKRRAPSPNLTEQEKKKVKEETANALAELAGAETPIVPVGNPAQAAREKKKADRLAERKKILAAQEASAKQARATRNVEEQYRAAEATRRKIAADEKAKTKQNSTIRPEIVAQADELLNLIDTSIAQTQEDIVGQSKLTRDNVKTWTPSRDPRAQTQSRQKGDRRDQVQLNRLLTHSQQDRQDMASAVTAQNPRDDAQRQQREEVVNRNRPGLKPPHNPFRINETERKKGLTARMEGEPSVEDMEAAQYAAPIDIEGRDKRQRPHSTSSIVGASKHARPNLGEFESRNFIPIPSIQEQLLASQGGSEAPQVQSVEREGQNPSVELVDGPPPESPTVVDLSDIV